jgi:hypothetical protein
MLHETSPPIISSLYADIRDNSRLNLSPGWKMKGTECEREGVTASDPQVPPSTP